MSRVLLDTTYMLPAIGVKVRRPLDGVLFATQDAGHETWISEITIFELLAKGAKLAARGKIDAQRLATGIRGILADESVVRPPAYENGVSETSVELRRFHDDFVDCIVIASALEHCNGLVSEERFGRNRDLLRFIGQKKPGFRLWTAEELARGS